jgi:2-dehydropantoate 2-reductase
MGMLAESKRCHPGDPMVCGPGCSPTDTGATASIRMSLGPIRENPLTRQFFLDSMKEVVAVGRARGIALPADYAKQRMNFADGLPRDMIASI